MSAALRRYSQPRGEPRGSTMGARSDKPGSAPIHTQTGQPRDTRFTALRSIAAGLCALSLCPALLGCGSGKTYYQPAVTARGELTLRYENEFQLYAGGQRVATGHRYSGLPHFVRCVPKASSHALTATSDGATGSTLSTLGIAFGVLGLGGFAGLAYYDKDPGLMLGILGAGIGAGVLGVVLAGVSRGFKNSANGHAADAMNYYNDAVGSLGASCDDLVYPPPAGPEPIDAKSGGDDREDMLDDAPAPRNEQDNPKAPEPPPPPPAPDRAGGAVPIR